MVVPGLLIGMAIAAAILALLSILRRERHQQRAGVSPGPVSLIYRLIATAIVLFVAALVAGIVYAVLVAPRPN